MNTALRIIMAAFVFILGASAGRLTAPDTSQKPVCVQVKDDDGTQQVYQLEPFPMLLVTRLSDGATMSTLGSIAEIKKHEKQVVCPRRKE